MASNLPAVERTDSAAQTKLYFDTYGKAPLEFPATEVAASIAFFEGRGFDKDAAVVVATTVLKQAKLENVPVFTIIEQLSSYTDLEISALIAEILNNNRTPTSTLGFKKELDNVTKTRNIYP
jgi:hypothetical protein